MWGEPGPRSVHMRGLGRSCSFSPLLFPVVSLPASLGITHTVFLFASPPILLFGPGSFLLEWAIHAHSQILL